MRRLGVVEYLNARPLSFGLERYPDRFSIRYDVPSTCVRLLFERQVDLGTVPSIGYLLGPELRIVPEIAIACDGPVESVAMFTTRPVEQIRTLALDLNSRTSVTLARILCRRHFEIAPEMRAMPQDPAAMLRTCDAAVVIGDAALFFDHGAVGADKIDLGEAWREYCGLPFVFAFWAGYPGALEPGDVEILQATRDAALADPDAVATSVFGVDPGRRSRGVQYLRDNVKYGLSPRFQDGVRRFFQEAVALGLAPADRDLRFF